MLTLRFGPLGDATSPPQACSKGVHPKFYVLLLGSGKSLRFFASLFTTWTLWGTGSKLSKFLQFLKASLDGFIKLRAHQVYKVHEF